MVDNSIGSLSPTFDFSQSRQPAVGDVAGFNQTDLEQKAVKSSYVPRAAIVAARAAESKFGADTVVLSMGDLLEVLDAYVITSGTNIRQVRVLVEEIEKRLKVEEGCSPIHIEGAREGTWTLMDYGDFIVHVFLQETRDYYDLEHLWSSAPRIDWVLD